MAIQNPDCATGLQAAPSRATPYDEMLTLAGGVRDHYAGLHQRIATLAPAEMAERQRTLERYFLLQGIFLFVIIGVLVANFLIDIVYVIVDPRVRLGMEVD